MYAYKIVYVCVPPKNNNNANWSVVTNCKASSLNLIFGQNRSKMQSERS